MAEAGAGRRRARQGEARRGGRVRGRAGEPGHQRSRRRDGRAVPERGAVQHAHRPDPAPRRVERRDRPAWLRRGRVGRHGPRRHDVQRHEDVPLDRRRCGVRSRPDSRGDRSGRGLHAEGRGPLCLGAQRADHVGAPASPDERLVGDALGKARLGRPSAAWTNARAMEKPGNARAGDLLQIQRHPRERARAVGALRARTAAAGGAERVDHGSDRRIVDVALGSVRQRVGGDRRASA